MAQQSRSYELVLSLVDKVSTSSRKIEGSLASLNSKINTFAGVLGVGLGAGAVIGFGKHLLDLGDKLSDLSDQTGISIGVLAGIKPLADQTGTSIESLAKGINKMMISLAEGAGGSGEQAEALKRLKISSDELRKSMSDPEGFLKLFAERLGTVENRAERLAIAKRLAGRASAELMPLLMKIADEGLPRVSKETEEAFKILGDLKDRLVVVSAEATNFWAALLGGAAKRLGFGRSFSDEIKGDIQQLESTLSIFRSMQQRGSGVGGEIEKAEKRLTALQNLLAKVEEGERRRAEVKPGALPIDLEKIRKQQEELRKLQAEALRPLFAQIDREQEEAIRAGQELNKIFTDLARQGLTESEQKIFDIEKRFNTLTIEVIENAEALGMADEAMAALLQKLEEAKKLELAPHLFPKDIAEGFEAFDRQHQEMVEANKTRMEELQKISERAAEGMQEAFAEFFDSIGTKAKSMDQILVGFFNGIRRSINQVLASMAVEGLFGIKPGQKEGLSLGGGLLGGLVKSIRGWIGFETGGVLPGGFVPMSAFQHGGVVQRPTFGFIGEGGPEAVVPLQHGSIPVKMESSQVIVNVINNTSARAEVSERRGGGGMKEITVLIDKELGDAVRSGGYAFRAISEVFGVNRIGARR